MDKFRWMSYICVIFVFVENVKLEKEELNDTKGAIRSRKTQKDWQYRNQKRMGNRKKHYTDK